MLRGKSEWSKSDRELFAAHTSKANDCEFCIVVHSAFASSRARNPTWIENIIDDKKTDGQSEELTEALKFIKKLTQQSWNIDESDIQRLRMANISHEGIEDAATASILLSMGNRLADGLGFEIQSPTTIRRGKPLLINIGYRLYAL